MPCLHAIESEDNENHFVCHIMNVLWLINDKGTHVLSSGYQAIVSFREIK